VSNELKAVMRIKMQFFKWFEDFFTNTANVFLGTDEQPKTKVGKKETTVAVTEPDRESKDDSSMSVTSCSEDAEVPNPQQHLTCLLCNQKGEFTVTGRLIPYKVNMFVHTSCAMWTNEVFDVDDGQLINFYQQQKKLMH